MRFLRLSEAQTWSRENKRRIVVEVGMWGPVGIADIYPGGRTVFYRLDNGKVYARWRKRLTPDSEFKEAT